ncbi:MAG: glycine--tRNA ligase subunit beta [Caldisericia bacterium]
MRVEVSSADDCMKKILESMGVIPGYQERKDFIFNNATKQASEIGLVVKRNENLLNELVGIVERPLVVVGEFPMEYIESTPDLVLRSVLISDLRFIPFEKPDGTLSNRFALIINGGGNLEKTTMAGEMKVLLGKLSDAKFFFEKDRQKKLEDYRDALSGIAFIKGLGTIEDKTERLVKISSDLSKFSDEKVVDLERSASLSKLDLATSLVREHDELQGEIGGLYASLDGENREISKAISQHYLPATETDILPETKTGQMLSLIDKTDSLVNLISAGSIPKGSADPLGVRRFATNIIRILIDGDIDENFEELIKVCLGYSIKKSETAFEDIVAFIKPRLEKILKDKGHKYDVVRASISDDISNIKDAERKCIAISAIYQKEEFTRIVETAKRLRNILKDWESIDFDCELFENGTEKEFAASAKSIFEKIDSAEFFEDKLNLLFELVGPADKYFEEILVNAEDEKIRNNRKNFLSWVLLGMFKISDFTAIAI